MFGTYSEKAKANAADVINQAGFVLYEFKHNDNGEVYVEDWDSKQKIIVYTG